MYETAARGAGQSNVIIGNRISARRNARYCLTSMYQSVRLNRTKAIFDTRARRRYLLSRLRTLFSRKKF